MLEEDFWSPEQWLGITDPRHSRGQHSSLGAHLLSFSKKKFQILMVYSILKIMVQLLNL